MKMNITALLLMIALMTIIGYILMTILINKNITNNLNKFYSALFMAIIMMMATIITTEKIEKNYVTLERGGPLSRNINNIRNIFRDRL